jgi:nitrous oxidase accessory protein NosD
LWNITCIDSWSGTNSTSAQTLYVDVHVPGINTLNATPLLEGTPVIFTINATDNMDNNLSFYFQFRDPTGNMTYEPPHYGLNAQNTHTYCQDDAYYPGVMVYDHAGNGNSGGFGSPLLIQNVAPTITNATLSITNHTTYVTATLTIGATDPGCDDTTLDILVNWTNSTGEIDDYDFITSGGNISISRNFTRNDEAWTVSALVSDTDAGITYSSEFNFTSDIICVNLSAESIPYYVTTDTILCLDTYYLNETNISSPKGIIVLNTSGVTLDCNGATIIGNDSGFGIVNKAANTLIENCNVANYDRAIESETGSRNSTIWFNNVSSSDYGLYDIYTGGDNTYLFNNVTNTNTGIFVYSNNYTNLYWNNIIDTGVGIYIYWGHDHNIYGNQISMGFGGIQIAGSASDITVWTNNITILFGGIFDNGTNDIFYNNYIDAITPAIAFGSGSRWNTTPSPGLNIIGGPSIGGNYYSDYTGTDNNGDGFGETPYPIPGTDGGIDYLPLTNTLINCSYAMNYTAGKIQFNGDQDVCNQSWSVHYTYTGIRGTTDTTTSYVLLLIPALLAIALIFALYKQSEAGGINLTMLFVSVIVCVILISLVYAIITNTTGVTQTVTDVIVNPLVTVWNNLTHADIIIGSETVTNGTVTLPLI